MERNACDLASEVLAVIERNNAEGHSAEKTEIEIGEMMISVLYGN